MQAILSNFIKRLTSRKFLLTVATCLTLYANQQYNELALTAIAYLFVEGAGDAAERFSKPKAETAKTELEATRLQILGADALPDVGVDKTMFVPGNTGQ